VPEGRFTSGRAETLDTRTEFPQHPPIASGKPGRIRPHPRCRDSQLEPLLNTPVMLLESLAESRASDTQRCDVQTLFSPGLLRRALFEYRLFSRHHTMKTTPWWLPNHFQSMVKTCFHSSNECHHTVHISRLLVCP
jgi:hypothetical protein